MKNEIIQDYIKLVEFLETIVPKNIEIVLHVIENDYTYIASIINGHVSGRDKYAPLTGFGLSLIENKVYQTSDYVTGYHAMSQNDKQVQSATKFIKEADGTLIGMLCINVDGTPYENILNNLGFLVNLNAHRSADVKNGSTVEYLVADIDQVIDSYIEGHYDNGNATLKREDKRVIIQELIDKKIFLLKGAIPLIAKKLNLAESSIYRYKKEAEKQLVDQS
ncbi:MAG: PAS domain-containing protein [Erysipelotrichaceae bacterium]|jgi:predicted transcriptional regulator YheO|nr:PAS domain-containing protein [Erysipelotrichaceae bacterium]